MGSCKDCVKGCVVDCNKISIVGPPGPAAPVGVQNYDYSANIVNNLLGGGFIFGADTFYSTLGLGTVNQTTTTSAFSPPMLTTDYWFLAGGSGNIQDLYFLVDYTGATGENISGVTITATVFVNSAAASYPGFVQTALTTSITLASHVTLFSSDNATTMVPIGVNDMIALQIAFGSVTPVPIVIRGGINVSAGFVIG